MGGLFTRRKTKYKPAMQKSTVYLEITTDILTDGTVVWATSGQLTVLVEMGEVLTLVRKLDRCVGRQHNLQREGPKRLACNLDRCWTVLSGLAETPTLACKPDIY